jgi:hypothetical protein
LLLLPELLKTLRSSPPPELLLLLLLLGAFEEEKSAAAKTAASGVEASLGGVGGNGKDLYPEEGIVHPRSPSQG